MRSNKGVTLTILIIYIIVLVLVIGILANISSNFYANKDYILENGKYISEFNKFNMYFIDDVKNNSNIYSIKEDEIIFADGTIYSFVANPDEAVYRNQVKICKNVKFCEFTKVEEKVNDVKKIVIKVRMIIDATEMFETSTEYVLRYW